MSATWIGSGVLRVNRARALAVLSRYQLIDPFAFLLPWLRLAACSGASWVDIDRISGGLALRFNGDPLDPERFARPWNCLFGSADEAPQGEERYSHLLSGVLAALRLEPAALSLSSGRARLRIESLERESLRPDLESEGTLLTVRWGGWDWLTCRSGRRALARAREALGLYPVPVRVAGRPLEGLCPASYPRSFDAGGLRGRHGPGEPGARGSRLWLYQRGVLAEAAEEDLGPLRVHVNCDRLSLGLSQSGVLRDAAYRRLLAELPGAIQPGPGSPPR